jgi:hypothetical protein
MRMTASRMLQEAVFVVVLFSLAKHTAEHDAMILHLVLSPLIDILEQRSGIVLDCAHVGSVIRENVLTPCLVVRECAHTITKWTLNYLAFAGTKTVQSWNRRTNVVLLTAID